MRALAVRLRSEGAYAVVPITASGDGAMWRVLRRDGMKFAAQLIEFILRQRDDGRATDFTDGADDALTNRFEHLRFRDVQQAGEFARAQEREIVARTWKVNGHTPSCRCQRQRGRDE